MQAILITALGLVLTAGAIMAMLGASRHNQEGDQREARAIITTQIYISAFGILVGGSGFVIFITGLLKGVGILH